MQFVKFIRRSSEFWNLLSILLIFMWLVSNVIDVAQTSACSSSILTLDPLLLFFAARHICSCLQEVDWQRCNL